MTDSRRFDVVCVGGGIVGLATARALALRFRASVAVIEAEEQTARHQTGRNSGVLHSGLYYAPGSLKARSCVEGRRRLVELCTENDIPFELCGKLVIATEPEEIRRLDELHRRGRANGLEGLERIDGARIPEFEPHAEGVAALWIPETGIVDYRQVAALYARQLQDAGGALRTSHRLIDIGQQQTERLELETTGGHLQASFLINCAGLQSDRVARMTGVEARIRIVPFRGDYFDLATERRNLLRGLIYPVPDPRFPFLGVHLTRRIDGSVEAGPNAVLALHREGYRPPRFSWRDTLDTITYPGLWRLGARYWRVGLGEYLRSGSRRRFAAALQRFVPEITAQDFTAGGCGIRAQALGRDGAMLDDFVIEHGPRSLHVLNAPSPAATASLAIGDQIANMAAESFDLQERST